MSPKQNNDWLPISILGVCIGITALIVVTTGSIAQHGEFSLKYLYQDLWGNIASELASITLTVLIIDRLNERRQRLAEERQERQFLLSQLRSSISHEAHRAAERLRQKKWLDDGMLQGAPLAGANLGGVDLSEADLRSANLSEANLEGANLTGANLAGAILVGTNLRGSDLSKASLTHANLAEADLTGAILLQTDLRDSFLNGTVLAEARLAEANLLDARGLIEEQLALASILSLAIMPDGSTYDGRFNLIGDLMIYGE